MVRTPAAILARCSILALAAAAAVLPGCIAAPPGPDGYGTIGGVVPLPALATPAQLDQNHPPLAGSDGGGSVLDRGHWAPIALLAPSDLTLHTPHYAPSRLPTTGDWRYDGTLPSELDVHEFGSGNAHQLKSLAYEPFLQAYDLVMIPVRMITGTPPSRLDASPDTSYVRVPGAWGTPLPRTGRPIGQSGGAVISRPAEGRQL